VKASRMWLDSTGPFKDVMVSIFATLAKQCLEKLGALYRNMGEYSKAEPLYQEALRIQQKVLGAEDADTAASLNNLATLYQAMGVPARLSRSPLNPAFVDYPKEGY
jgi:tetratricopeptide (TPR) repeat protein